jgi:hypothetical protein
MLNIEPTPLQKVLDNPIMHNGLYVPSSHKDPILGRYAFPAIKLAFNPIINYIPSGRYCIAGGIFRSLFFNEIPTDVDIYPLETALLGGIPINEFISFAAEPDCLRIESDKLLASDTRPINKFSRLKALVKSSNSNIDILTLKLSELPYNFQIICKSNNLPDGTVEVPVCANDIISSFDIVPACFGVDVTIYNENKTDALKSGWSSFELNEVLIHPDYFYSVANKYLITNKSQNTFGRVRKITAARFYKYIVDYGFRIPNNSEMSVFNELLGKPGDDLDLEYV